MSNYKRLTKKENGCWGIDGKLVNQNQKALDVFEEAFSIAITRLAELEDKIENGTLIELPCKVGDTVWYIKSFGYGRYKIDDMVVAGFNFSRFEDAIWVVGLYEEQSSHIYKTKAEAEEKLKETRK